MAVSMLLHDNGAAVAEQREPIFTPMRGRIVHQILVLDDTVIPDPCNHLVDDLIAL